MHLNTSNFEDAYGTYTKGLQEKESYKKFVSAVKNKTFQIKNVVGNRKTTTTAEAKATVLICGKDGIDKTVIYNFQCIKEGGKWKIDSVSE
jgi:hypothetical protein